MPLRRRRRRLLRRPRRRRTPMRSPCIRPRACAVPRRSRRSASAAHRADDLGEIAVTGSRSGRHDGRLEEHSDGKGASFMPSAPFTEGERVTVRTDLDIANAEDGDFEIRIARRARTPNDPQAGALQQGQGRGAGARNAPRADPAGGDGAHGRGGPRARSDLRRAEGRARPGGHDDPGRHGPADLVQARRRATRSRPTSGSRSTAASPCSRGGRAA